MNKASSLRIIVRTRDQGIVTGEWGTDETWECSNWKAAYAIVDRLDPGRKETLRIKLGKNNYNLDVGGIEEAADRKAKSEKTQNRINALIEKSKRIQEWARM